MQEITTKRGVCTQHIREGGREGGREMEKQYAPTNLQYLEEGEEGASEGPDVLFTPVPEKVDL